MSFYSKSFLIYQIARGAQKMSLYSKRQINGIRNLESLGYVIIVGDMIKLTPKGQQVVLYGMVGDEEPDSGSPLAKFILWALIVLVVLAAAAIGYFIHG